MINEVINTCIYSISQEMQACGQIPAFSLYLLSLFNTISLFPSQALKNTLTDLNKIQFLTQLNKKKIKKPIIHFLHSQQSFLIKTTKKVK